MPPSTSVCVTTMSGSNMHHCEPGPSKLAKCGKFDPRLPGTANSGQPKKRPGRPRIREHGNDRVGDGLSSQKGPCPGDDNLCVSGDEIDLSSESDYNVFAGGDEGKEMDECVRQKKYSYLQSQDGRPAEMYRTDLIHRVRAGEFDEDDSSDDESGDVKMVKLYDKWREEWSTGVQVPVNIVALPDFRSSAYDLQPRPKRNPYKMPRKMIGKEGKKYVRENTHEISPVLSLRLYEGDRLDEIWLLKYNEIRLRSGRAEVFLNDLLSAINEFEIDCYKNIHRALLEPLHSPSTKGIDEDAPCDICRLKDCEQDDDMVYCEGCHMCVHLSCYGLQEVPTEEWTCKTCEVKVGLRPPCILCPVTGGAMKSTKNGDQWAHIVCALYMPECRFGNAEERENIMALEEIPDERWKMRCSICDTRQGACIQCCVKSCATAFHVSCAQRKGLEMRIEQGPEDEIKFITLCERHSHNSHKEDDLAGDIRRIEGRTKPVNHSSDSIFSKSEEVRRIEQHFYLFVNWEKISKRLGLDQMLVSDLYEYWKQKRHRNSGRALAKNAHDEIFVGDTVKLCLPGALGDQIKAQSTFLCKRQLVYGVGRLLKDLDMCRNLIYMQKKREKEKMEKMEIDFKVIDTIFKMVTSPVPFGQRANEIMKVEFEKIMSPDEIEEVLRLSDNENVSESSGISTLNVPVPGLRNFPQTKMSSSPSKHNYPSPANGEDQNKNTVGKRMCRKRSKTIALDDSSPPAAKRLRERNGMVSPRYTKRGAAI